MKRFLTFVGRSMVMLFVLWHMAAVGIYAVPSEWTFGPAARLRGRLHPYIAPYILSTSQWQQWNMFSPNPLQLVTYYNIKTAESSGEWRQIAAVRSGTYPWWRHAARFKFYNNLFDNLDGAHRHVVENFLQLACLESGQAAGTPIRLEYARTTVPGKRGGAPEWKTWSIIEDVSVAHETICIPPA